MKLEIVVVATHKRKPLIVPYLSNKSHKVHYTKDYNLPDGFESSPEAVGCVLNHQHQGVYRCFRGHQNALSM